MEDALAAKAELMKRFPSIIESVRVQRQRRVWLEVPGESLAGVLDALIQEMSFSILCSITGLDQGDRLGVVYHLAREDGLTLGVKTSVLKAQPVLQTVTNHFPAAELYERELVDLLGMQVLGLPAGPRYPLPDDWPDGQFPLRKDWDPKSLDQEPSGPSEAHHA